MLSYWDFIFKINIFVFLAVSLGMTARLVDTADNNNTEVNFCLFACAFGILSSIYVFVAYFVNTLSLPIILFILDFINFAFTFAGGTAFANALGVHGCETQWYVLENEIVQGSTFRCRISKVAIIYIFLSCVLFLASLILNGIFMMRNGMWSHRKETKLAYKSSVVERSPPNMAQV